MNIKFIAKNGLKIINSKNKEAIKYLIHMRKDQMFIQPLKISIQIMV